MLIRGEDARRDDREDQQAIRDRPGNTDKTGRFIDPDFPADVTSLFRNYENPPRGHIPKEAVKWLRPHEFVAGAAPVLFADASTEIIQGCLGDCWFLGALAAISVRKELVEIVVPASHNGPSYGIYTVRFYKYGQWKNVVIDDRIPCDPTGTPLYARSSVDNEIWVSLVEKAYAKMHGCYESIVNGSMSYALKDLTGGAPQTISLREDAVQDLIMNGTLWLKMKLWAGQGLLGCAQDVRNEKDPDWFDGGIRPRRSYGILETQEPMAGRRFLKMKCFFPKKGKQWTGMWADDGPEWYEHPELRVALNHNPGGDPGEFWMSFEDWTRYFHFLYVCQLFPASWMVPMTTDPEPEPLVLQGRWGKTELCGGSLRAGNGSWWKNPQFKLTLTSGKPTQVFITLSQRDMRYNPIPDRFNGNKPFQKPSTPKPDLDHYDVAIGFVVVRKSKLESLQEGAQLRKNEIELMSRPFRKQRDATIAQPKVLDPSGGDLIIIAMVYDPEEVIGELEFWLSVAASKDIRLEPLKTPIKPLKSTGGNESDDESDNEYDDKQLREPAFVEYPVGGRKKGARPPREKRTPEQIIKCCEKLNQPYIDPDFLPGPGMISSEPKGISDASDLVFLRPCWSGPRDPSRHLNVGHPPLDPPVLFLEGGAPGSIKQGRLADGWLLGAMAAVATKLDVLKSLFVHWDLQWGVFCVRIFKEGRWVEVIIDDLLPCAKANPTPMFAVGVDPDKGGAENPRALTGMWVALLEKAYAKAHGCYQNLAHGTIPYGLKDLTGGAPQALALDDDAVHSQIVNGTLWRKMLDWTKSGCLLTVKFGGERVDHGFLRKGSAYAIIDVREVEDGSLHRMVQLFDPWASEWQWDGPWGNKSKKWLEFRVLAEQCRHTEPNTFWMEADESDKFEKGEFFRSFEDGTLIVTRIFPKTWQQSRKLARWTQRTAMGPPFQNKWLANPQFELHVHEPRTLCFIAVGQQDLRRLGRNVYNHPVGFVVVPARVIHEKGVNVDRQDWVNPPPIEFNKDREAALSFAITLDPKDSPYVVLPFTKLGITGPIFLSVWHNKAVLVRGGAITWSGDDTGRDHADDDDDGLDEAKQPDPDYDIESEMHTVQGSRRPAPDAAPPRGRDDQEERVQRLEAKSASASVPAAAAARDGAGKDSGAQGARDGRAGRSWEGGGGGGGGGGGVSGSTIHVEGAVGEGEEAEMIQKIVKLLPRAELWQLHAVFKILKP